MVLVVDIIFFEDQSIERAIKTMLDGAGIVF